MDDILDVAFDLIESDDDGLLSKTEMGSAIMYVLEKLGMDHEDVDWEDLGEWFDDEAGPDNLVNESEFKSAIRAAI